MTTSWKRIIKKPLVAALTALTLTGAAVAPSADVEAATSSSLRYMMSIRTGPTTSYQLIATWGAGTAISVDCQTTGSRWGEGSYANNVTWDRLTNGYYVHDMGTNLAGGQKVTYSNGTYGYFTPGIPRCASTPAIDKAAAWALGQVGQAYASGSDATSYAWSPGPYAEWSGDCYYFTVRASTRAGRTAKQGYGSAINTYRAYANEGRIRSGTPQVGAIVFYNLTAYGHAAIYVGNGQVVSTQGMDGNRLPITKVSLDHFSGRLGWVMP